MADVAGPTVAALAGPTLSRRVKSLTGDEKAHLHNSVAKSVVTVHVDPGDPEDRYTAPGTIIMTEQSSCYIVVVRRIIHHKFNYEIEFAGIRVKKKGTDFLTARTFGVIKIDHHLDLNQITAVQFAKEPVYINERVYLIGLLGGALTSGYNVNRAGTDTFLIDCPPDPWSEIGAPVFDENEEIVGIVFQFIGACVAMTVSSIKKQLKTLEIDELHQKICNEG